MCRIAIVTCLHLALICAFAGTGLGDLGFEGQGRQTGAVWSLEGTPESPAAGDVVRRDDMPFVLDGPRIPKVRLEGEGHRLVDATSGRLIAVRITAESNPLAALTEEERGAIRGVRLDSWSDDIAASLGGLDWTRVCVRVDKGAAVAAGRKLPELPPDVERLVLVDESFVQVEMPGRSNVHTFEDDPGFRTVDALRRLEHLVLLVAEDIDLPLALLGEAKDLRVLVPSRAEGVLPVFPELRHLDLSSFTEVTSIDACRSMPKLRNLFLQGGDVTDLSPLDGHPGLEELDVRGLNVKALPAGRLPRLARVRAIGSRVTASDEDYFRGANPQCFLRMHYKPMLLDALPGVNRIVLREPNGDLDEPPVHVCEDAEEIRAFLDAIEIDEAESGGHCMCSGSVALWLFRDRDVLVLMSFHHGLSLRWADWPGDATLTPPSQLALSEMVARWGFPGPLEELQEHRQRALAGELRDLRVAAVLPPSVLGALSRAETEEQAVAAFVDGLPDALERAATLLRVIGSGERTWSRLGPLDQLALETLLPAIDAAILGRAAQRVVGEEAGLRGLGCWLFERRQAASLPPATLDAVLPAVAAHAFAHPREENRRRAIQALGALVSPTALRILVARVESDLAVRALPAEEVVEPAGWVMYRSFPGDVDLECGDVALAATVLAGRDHAPSLAAIEARLEDPDVADRAILEAARARLHEAGIR